MRNVQLNPELLRRAAEIPPDIRNSVESAKESKEIDDILAETMIRHYNNNPSIITFDDIVVKDTKENIFRTWDPVIALVALCKNSEEVIHLMGYANAPGRRGGGVVVVDRVRLDPRLTYTFARIAIEQKLHPANDYRLLRQKRKAVYLILNDSMDRKPS